MRFLAFPVWLVAAACLVLLPVLPALAMHGVRPAVRPGRAASASDIKQAQILLLGEINSVRAQQHLKPLKLNKKESKCALVHSKHMAAQGQISHDQFPADICVPHGIAGENVGFGTGDPLSAVPAINQQMVDEGPCPHKSCPGIEFEAHGHYVNIVNPIYTSVGLGIAFIGGSTWVCEDFVQ